MSAAAKKSDERMDLSDIEHIEERPDAFHAHRKDGRILRVEKKGMDVETADAIRSIAAGKAAALRALQNMPGGDGTTRAEEGAKIEIANNDPPDVDEDNGLTPDEEQQLIDEAKNPATQQAAHDYAQDAGDNRLEFLTRDQQAKVQAQAEAARHAPRAERPEGAHHERAGLAMMAAHEDAPAQAQRIADAEAATRALYPADNSVPVAPDADSAPPDTLLDPPAVPATNDAAMALPGYPGGVATSRGSSEDIATAPLQQTPEELRRLADAAQGLTPTIGDHLSPVDARAFIPSAVGALGNMALAQSQAPILDMSPQDAAADAAGAKMALATPASAPPPAPGTALSISERTREPGAVTGAPPVDDFDTSPEKIAFDKETQARAKAAADFGEAARVEALNSQKIQEDSDARIAAMQAGTQQRVQQAFDRADRTLAWLADPAHDIDRNRLFHQQTTGQAIMQFIGILLGGQGSVDMIRDAVNGDVEAQIKNRASKNSLVRQYMELGHSLEESGRLAVADEMTHAAGLFKREAFKAASVQAVANANSKAAELQQEAFKTITDVHNKRLENATILQKAADAHALAQSTMAYHAFTMKQKELGADLLVRDPTTGRTYTAISKGAAVKAQTLLEANGELNDWLARMKGFQAKNHTTLDLGTGESGPFHSDADIEGLDLQSEGLKILSKLNGATRFSKESVDIDKNRVPHPGRWRQDVVTRELNELVKEAQSKSRAALNAYTTAPFEKQQAQLNLTKEL